MVQGSRLLLCLGMRLDGFSSLKTVNDPAFYLEGRFALLHETFWLTLYMEQYARCHSKNRTVLQSHFPGILPHAPFSVQEDEANVHDARCPANTLRSRFPETAYSVYLL